VTGADVDAPDIAGDISGIVAGELAGRVGGQGGVVLVADERGGTGGLLVVAGLAVFAAIWMDSADVAAAAGVGLADFAGDVAEGRRAVETAPKGACGRHEVRPEPGTHLRGLVCGESVAGGSALAGLADFVAGIVAGAVPFTGTCAWIRAWRRAMGIADVAGMVAGDASSTSFVAGEICRVWDSAICPRWRAEV